MKKSLFFALCMGAIGIVGCYDGGLDEEFDKEGEICTGDVQCESEYCDSEIKKCKAKPAEPQKCVNDSECASNYCIHGFCGTYDN